MRNALWFVPFLAMLLMVACSAPVLPSDLVAEAGDAVLSLPRSAIENAQTADQGALDEGSTSVAISGDANHGHA